MANLDLTAKIKEEVRNHILQTHETKTQQQEMIAFSESMPPSRNVKINALNFKKALYKSVNMISLRLDMRERFLKRLKNLSRQDLNNPNLELPDIKKGDREFRKLVEKLVHDLTIRNVMPEEVIIMQSHAIMDMYGNFDEEKAFFYIILNGSFKVSTLKFNKNKSKKKKD